MLLSIRPLVIPKMYWIAEWNLFVDTENPLPDWNKRKEVATYTVYIVSMTRPYFSHLSP